MVLQYQNFEALLNLKTIIVQLQFKPLVKWIDTTGIPLLIDVFVNVFQGGCFKNACQHTLFPSTIVIIYNVNLDLKPQLLMINLYAL